MVTLPSGATVKVSMDWTVTAAPDGVVLDGSREAIEDRSGRGRRDRRDEGGPLRAPGRAGIRASTGRSSPPPIRRAGEGWDRFRSVTVQDVAGGSAAGVGVRREEGPARGGRPRRRPLAAGPSGAGPRSRSCRTACARPATCARPYRGRRPGGSTRARRGAAGVHRAGARGRRRARGLGRGLRRERDAHRGGLRGSRAGPARAGDRGQPVRHRVEHQVADHAAAGPPRRRGPLRAGRRR